MGRYPIFDNLHFAHLCGTLYLRIGAHPGAAQPYLASPPPPPPIIDYMMYGVCDMVSYLNNFFTEDNTMTKKENALLNAIRDPQKLAEIINVLQSDRLSRGLPAMPCDKQVLTETLHQ